VILATIIGLALPLQASMDAHQFRAMARQRPSAEIASAIGKWFSQKELTDGAVKRHGLEVVWAMSLPGKKEALVSSKIGHFEQRMRDVGGGLFVADGELPEGTALNWVIESDGKTVTQPRQLEAYAIRADNVHHAGVLQSEVRKMPNWKSKVFAGTDREWWLYIPANASGPVAVMVFQDGQWSHNYVPNALDNLIAKKEIPAMAALFIAPGTFADGKSNRSFEYDTLSDQYVRFLLDEMLPEAAKVIPLKSGGENRAIAGNSSGGICAFTAAWERPSEFRRVFSCIGSFANIAMGPTQREGGHNYPFLIRANEKKPIRVFLQDGENDLDNRFGNWFLGNQQMERALAYAGYDYQFAWGKGFHSDQHGQAILPDVLRWLWRPL
jgi:enterochelin esterase family protein